MIFTWQYFSLDSDGVDEYAVNKLLSEIFNHGTRLEGEIHSLVKESASRKFDIKEEVCSYLLGCYPNLFQTPKGNSFDSVQFWSSLIFRDLGFVYKVSEPTVMLLLLVLLMVVLLILIIWYCIVMLYHLHELNFVEYYLTDDGVE